MSNSEKSINRFFEDVQQIEADLTRYKDFFDRDFLHQIQFEVESLRQIMSKDEEDANILRIGIVGAMKAGKSSFLNMLLFDGKNVLPKASTPMTAALTRIVYSREGSRAIVHYYSAQDWQKIEDFEAQYQEGLKSAYEEYCRSIEVQNQNAQRSNRMSGTGGVQVRLQQLMSEVQYEQKFYRQSNVSEFELAAHELVLGMETDDSLRSKLGKSDEIVGDDFTQLLAEYVGADGKYTPIVNYVELETNCPDLEGVEIVDMPGLGDPIVSRCRVTKEFVKHCDVVLFLSTCSQFITNRDKDALVRLLPAAGIPRGLVIASRFDGSITGYFNKCDLRAAYHKERQRLEARYEQEIQTLPGKLRQAFGSHPLLITSAMADSLSRKRKNGIPFEGDEPKVYESLKSMNNGKDLTVEELRELAGIRSVKKELKGIQDDKRQILAQGKDEKVASAQNNVKNLIAQLLETIQLSTRTLEQQTVEGARAKRLALESALDRAASSIASHFSEASLGAQKKIQDLDAQLGMLRHNFTSLEVQTRSHTEFETVESGLFGWKKDTYEYSVKEYSVETAQIEDQVQLYAANCRQQVSRAFDFLLDTDHLRRSITDIVLTAVGDEVQEEDVLTPLRILFAAIKLPSVEVDPNSYVDEVRSQYPRGVAKNDEIHQANQTLSKLLTDVHQDIAKQLKACAAQIKEMLTRQSADFVTSLRNRMGGELKRIEIECADKEKNLKERRKFVDLLHKIQDQRLK